MGHGTQELLDLSAAHIETIDSVNRNQWNHVVKQAPHGSVFHRYEWLEAIEMGTTHTPKHAVVYKKDNLVGIFPNVVSSIGNTPFRRLTSIEPGFGGPLVTTDEEASLTLLFDQIQAICDREVITHLFQPVDPEAVRYQSTFDTLGYRPTVASCRFEVDLRKGWETILADMESSRRRAIQNADTETADVIDEELTRETMERFYTRYQSVMDRLEETPYPRSFFLALLEMRDRLKLFSLSVDGETRGMLLYLLDDEQSAVHYFFSGVTESDFEYDASELLHEREINWGIENGYETYDFGATRADYSHGLFKFKAKFGGEVVPIVSWEKGYSRALWPLFRTGRQLYQRYTTTD